MQSLAVQREGIRLEIQHSTVFIFIMFSFSFSSFSHHPFIHSSYQSQYDMTQKDEGDKKCDNTVNAKHYENKHGINKKEMIKDQCNKNAKAVVKGRFHYSCMKRWPMQSSLPCFPTVAWQGAENSVVFLPFWGSMLNRLKFTVIVEAVWSFLHFQRSSSVLISSVLSQHVSGFTWVDPRWGKFEGLAH